MCEYFRDAGAGRAALHRQHLPLRAGGLRGVGAARPHAVSAVGYQPTMALRDGRPPGAHHLDRQGLDHLDAGRSTCPPTTITDPAPVATFAHLDSTIVLERAHRRARHLPGRGSAALHLADARPAARRRGALRRGPRGPAHPPALRGPARTSSPSSASRSSPTRTGRGGPRPPHPAVPLPALLRRRAVHRHPRAVREGGRHRALASRRSSRASTTSCPRRPSTWWAASTTSSRKAEKLAAVGEADREPSPCRNDLRARDPHSGADDLRRRVRAMTVPAEGSPRSAGGTRAARERRGQGEVKVEDGAASPSSCSSPTASSRSTRTARASSQTAERRPTTSTSSAPERP